jgi:hypothetical protein
MTNYYLSEGLNGAVHVKRDLAYDSPSTSIDAIRTNTNPWEALLDRKFDTVITGITPNEEFQQYNYFYPSGYAPQIAEDPIASGIQQDTLY